MILLYLNGNTVVSIEGNGRGLKNGIIIKNEIGVNYFIISVGIGRMKDGNITTSTDLIVDGIFEGKIISLV